MTSKSILISCQWDWCRLTFSTLDDLQLHVKRDHVQPMKPLRKSQITLLRRLDGMDASLRSSDSYGGTVASLDSIDRSKLSTSMPHTPPSDRMQNIRTQRDAFRTFRHLSSPAGMASVGDLPVSPNLDSLIEHRGTRSLSTAMERFEQIHNHKSSTSSQDAVEQQLTQEDEVDAQIMPPSHSSLHADMSNEKDLTDSKFIDVELQWPASDDEAEGEDVHDLDSPPMPNQSPESSNIVIGKKFHSGSLEVFPFPSGHGSASIASAPHGSTNMGDSQESHELTQPFALQTQAPYFSQSIDSSQSQ